jgi:hypothetical protein
MDKRVLLFVIGQLLALCACDSANQRQGDTKGADAAPSTSDGMTDSGSRKLDILIPAGAVGNDYWIYLNGDIARAPSANAVNPKNPDLMLAGVPEGAEPRLYLSGSRGFGMRFNEADWDQSVSYYFQSDPHDSRHIFQTTEVPLPTGTSSVTVEVAYYSPGDVRREDGSQAPRAFPFAITKKIIVEVQAGQRARLIPALPTNYSVGPATPRLYPAYMFCPDGPPERIAQGLKEEVNRYRNDPDVAALRNALFLWSGSGPTVTIEFPAEEGGTRDFDGTQIADIATATAANHYFPSQDDLSECENRYPALAGIFAQVGMTASKENKEMESFRKFGSDLKAQ